jgi:hypothetical protein
MNPTPLDYIKFPVGTTQDGWAPAPSRIYEMTGVDSMPGDFPVGTTQGGDPARNRTRGAVCLERVGASPSMTPGAQVEAPGHQGNQESKPARTSQPASMVRSRGGVESPEKAMPHQARAGDGPELEDADQSQRLDAACRHSPSRVVIRRRSRSGTVVETRVS